MQAVTAVVAFVLTVITMIEWLPILNITRVSVCGFLLSVTVETITILHFHLHPTRLCVILFLLLSNRQQLEMNVIHSSHVILWTM